MAREVNRGFFTEFKQTPEEKDQRDIKKRLANTEKQVEQLTENIDRLRETVNILLKVIGGIDEE